MAVGHSLTTLVEELLRLLSAGELADGFRGTFKRGSAQGLVTVLTPSEDPEFPLLLVSLEIMRAPKADPEGLFTRLLELNGALAGRAAFCLTSDGLICLQAGRPIEELDAGELVDLIVWTADQADEFDDILLDEFGRDLAP